MLITNPLRYFMTFAIHLLYKILSKLHPNGFPGINYIICYTFPQ